MLRRHSRTKGRGQQGAQHEGAVHVGSWGVLVGFYRKDQGAAAGGAPPRAASSACATPALPPQPTTGAGSHPELTPPPPLQHAPPSPKLTPPSPPAAAARPAERPQRGRRGAGRQSPRGTGIPCAGHPRPSGSPPAQPLEWMQHRRLPVRCRGEGARGCGGGCSEQLRERALHRRPRRQRQPQPAPQPRRTG